MRNLSGEAPRLVLGEVHCNTFFNKCGYKSLLYAKIVNIM
jgi:hypothetical protein